MKKGILFFSCVALLVLMAAASFMPSRSAFAAGSNVISWGLSYRKSEMVPDPPDGSHQLLSDNNGIYVVDTQEKKAYFTFDLGYEAGYTAEVLDILKENNIKATFFLCGNYLQEDELINRMINEGHQIGNHTNKHKDLPSLSTEAAKEDITLFAEKFNEKYGQGKAPLNYFRPPQGRFDERTLKLAKEQNMKTVMWSIAIADWGKTPIDAAAMSNKISGRIHPGAIILFHITNSGTPKMLRMLIPELTKKGYTIANSNEI